MVRSPEMGRSPEEPKEKPKVKIIKKGAAESGTDKSELTEEQKAHEEARDKKMAMRDFAAELKLAADEKVKDRTKYKDLDDFTKIFPADK